MYVIFKTIYTVVDYLCKFIPGKGSCRILAHESEPAKKDKKDVEMNLRTDSGSASNFIPKPMYLLVPIGSFGTHILMARAKE